MTDRAPAPVEFSDLLGRRLAHGEKVRDLLVEAMFKCEANGLPIIFTVHDEIVAQTRGDSVPPSTW